MINTESRKEFEAWFMSSEDYQDGHLDVRFDDEDLYINQDVQLDWNVWQVAWQASRTKPIAMPIIYTVDNCQYYYKADIQEAIEEAGYRWE